MNMLGRKIDWDDTEDVRRYNRDRGKIYERENKKEIAARKKQYREDNKEMMKIREKKSREKNKNTRRKYEKENREIFKIRKKEYYKKNKDKINIKSKKYYENNKDEIKTKTMRYYENNKDKILITNAKRYEESKKNICIICGELASVKYCGDKCKGIGNSGENNCNWNGGKSFGPYPQTWTTRFKKQVRDRDNNKCMRCGRGREEFNRALDVHHIDGIKENTSKESCITLCIPCHNLTKGKEEFFAKGFYSMLKRLYGYEYEETNLKIIEKEVKENVKQ